MTPLPSFPPAVHQYVARVFREANRRLGQKIVQVPNCPEPSLDTTLIEHLSHFSAPRVVMPGWAVRIDVHFLGGLRHFRQWEIADIGVLVLALKDGVVLSQKVALLQSKRLFPVKHGIREETSADYQLGFARLLPGSSKILSMAQPYRFDFAGQSAYREIHVGNPQYKAIARFEEEKRLPVYYLLYNPWAVPSSYELPSRQVLKLGVSANGGARIVPAKDLRRTLSSRDAGYSPQFQDISDAISKHRREAHGWRLEHFVAYRLLRCKEGRLFESLDEDDISALFYRRTGPIAAAVSVAIEEFGTTGH